jgi:putative lipoic acid-binding regulatory protein
MGVGGEPGLCFPCSFPIKAMGRAEEGFDLMIFEIVRRHSPGLGEAAVRSRLSTGGRYMAVTVTIEAMSQAQLDAIYRELSSHERVMMAL